MKNSTIWNGGTPNLGKPKLRAIVILVGMLLLYLPFLSRHLVGDDIGPLLRVERGPGDDYLEPRHMFHLFVGYGFYSAWKWLGYSGGAFEPLAVISALSGGLGIFLFFLVLFKVSRDRTTSVLISLLAGVSYGFWYHSTTMRVGYNVMAVAPTTLSLLMLVLVWERSDFSLKRRYTIFAAMSLGVAMVFYQAAVLLVPALIVGLFLDKQLPEIWERVKLIILFGLVLGITAGIPYLVVGVFVKGLRTPADFIVWWTTYSTSLPMWGSWSPSRIPTLIQTIIGYIVPLNEGLRLRDLSQGIIHPDRLIPQFSVVVSLLSFAAGTVYLVRYWRRLWSKYATPLVVSLVFLLCSIAFFLWFDPFEMQYWMVHFVPVWIFMAIVVADARREFSKFSSAILAWSLLFLFVVAFSTFSLSIYPRRFKPDPHAEKARLVVDHMTADDVIITPTWGWTDLIPYVAKREVISVLSISARVDADRTEQLRRLDQIMSEVWGRGGHVYLVDVFSYDPGQWQFITVNTNLTIEDFERYERRQAWLNKDEIIWEIVRE